MKAMKQINIFSRWICLAMLLGCVGVSWGQTTWTKLTTDGGNLPSGNYQIQNGNLAVKNTITVCDGQKVVIDLNGYVLSGGGTGLAYVIKVEGGGELTIKDSNPTLPHGGSLNKDAHYILDWVGANGNKSFFGGTIYNDYVNTVTDRKGIEVSGICIIERANIMGCYSTTYGAAVTVKASGSFTMKGGEISYNCARYNGGGIYSQGSLSIKNSKIQYNKAIGVDGTNNVTGGCGGGIYVASSEDVINCDIEYSEINYNYASVYGGGIYSNVNTEIKNSKITHNQAMHSELNYGIKWDKGRGGGFCFLTKNFVLDNTEVTYNACMYYGGGGHISGAILTQKNGTKINNNTSVLHGAGGLHVTANAHFKFVDGEISNNVAHSVGGGIHSSYGCTLELTGGTISSNKAEHRGGGVHINTGGDLTLNGTNIISNEVYNGLDYKYSTVTFEPDGSTSWSDPTSDNNVPYDKAGYGGGVMIDAGHCTMMKGALSYNKAKVGGGGLALVMINTDANTKEKIEQLKVVQFTLNDGTIQGNTTEGDGAGIYLMENTMEMPTVDPSEEGVKEKLDELLNGVPEAFINGGTLTDNVATGNGGALLVNGNVTMTGGKFEINKANNGGGICVLGGTVDITSGTISNNTATNYGGGVYVENTDPKAEITLRGGGIFEKNIAKAGGGMAVNGPFTFNFTGTIQNNNAVNGGGIYLLKGTSATKGATLHFNGGFIRNNTATGTPKLTGQTAFQKDVNAVTGVGGGVFMADYTTLDFNVTNKELGFYGNRATNAADDIFANGNGTSVTLPKVNDMTLAGFSVPANRLFWAEDFYSHYENNAYEADSRYQTLLSGQPSFTDPEHNLRYQFALQNLKKKHVIEVPDQKIENKYVCLALGYEIFYITIQKKGLKIGESAMFDISTAKDGVPNPYISMLLTGDGNGMVKKRIALPQGTWTVSEKTDWGWSYSPKGNTSIVKEVNDDEQVFEFENEKIATETLHDEAIKVNKMSGTSTTVQ